MPTKIVTTRQLFIYLASTILPEERESVSVGNKLLSSGWPATPEPNAAEVNIM